jgi:hypothetical protein
MPEPLNKNPKAIYLTPQPDLIVQVVRDEEGCYEEFLPLFFEAIASQDL